MQIFLWLFIRLLKSKDNLEMPTFCFQISRRTWYTRLFSSRKDKKKQVILTNQDLSDISIGH